MDVCFAYKDYEFMAMLVDGMIEKLSVMPTCDLIAVTEFTGHTMPEDMTETDMREGVRVITKDLKALRKKIKIISGV